MLEANVIFTLDGVNLTIKCTTEDKIKDICKKYSTKINKNMDSLIFLYFGNEVNFELSFKEQANIVDRYFHEMKILVNKNNINNNIIISNTINTKSYSENFNYLINGNLLENIKSIFFLRILLSHLDLKIKLKVIKYNKKLKKQIDIKLINYKFYSGKYIVYETNIKGKEYDGNDDNLLFEGEYLNGERNGKGNEYYYGKLVFEGEYLNGKRNGKGKEYYYDKLIFEGKFLNDKRNGKGKEYYKDGKLKFEGEFLNDERLTGKLYDNNGNLYCDLKSANGLIKEYNDDGKLIFEGEYLNGKKNGKGKEYDNNNGKLIFEGEYLNGKRNGKGKEYDYFLGKLKFDGDYLNGKKNGKGKEYYENGNIEFEGIYNNGERYSGIGYDTKNNKAYELKNGEGYIKKYYLGGIYIFEGEYLNGLINGKGKEYIFGDLRFEGEYLYSQKLRGKYYIDDKLEYEGEFLYNKKWNGKGYDENGNIIYELKNGTGKIKEYNDKFFCSLIYEGECLNGKRNGKGKEYYSDGKISFEGEYLNGKRNGKGKEYDSEGKIKFEGEYLDDNKVSE